MLEKITEKFLESAISGYQPRLELFKVRIDELAAAKSKEHLQAKWKHGLTEIAKARNIDVSDISKKMRF
jgi:hypothetical protein